MKRRIFLDHCMKGLVASQCIRPLDLFSGTILNKTGFAYDERCLLHPHSPEVPERVTAIRKILSDNGILNELIPITPLSDVIPRIRRIHTEAHISSVQNISLTGVSATSAVEGALGAIKAVSDGTCRNAFCALRPPGHHAHNSGAEEGFCFFNNVAIAARYAQQELGHAKILIIDWDYHHGNSTQDAFYSDASVLFFSTHNWRAYPGTGDPAMTGEGDGLGFNINVHLDCGATDDDMLAAWQTQLVPKVDSFQPDFILISAGFDSRKDDTLGCFRISDDGYVRMTKLAMRMADTYCGGRLVSLLEGGYNVDGVAAASLAHVSTLLGRDIAVENRRRSKTGPVPSIRQEHLVVPENLAAQILEAGLFSIDGRRIYALPLTRGGKTPLVRPGLSKGRYYVRLTYLHDAPCILPFHY